MFIYNRTESVSPRTQAQVEVIQRINPQLGFSLVTFDMALDRLLPHELARSRYPPVTMARLFVSKLVDEDYILYVDCNTICGRDFSEEINRYLNPFKVLHAVRDIGIDVPFMRSYFHRMGIVGADYMNSGILFMKNGPQLDQLLMRAVQWTHDNANTSEIPDQDSLYFAFGNTNTGKLPQEFNCYFCRRTQITDVVFHHGRNIRVLNSVISEFERLTNCRIDPQDCTAISRKIVARLQS
jgi:lipopolysaccharide biosynthesis glycosyltransferase